CHFTGTLSNSLMHCVVNLIFSILNDHVFLMLRVKQVHQDTRKEVKRYHDHHCPESRRCHIRGKLVCHSILSRDHKHIGDGCYNHTGSTHKDHAVGNHT